jgi:hypothetical protein
MWSNCFNVRSLDEGRLSTEKHKITLTKDGGLCKAVDEETGVEVRMEDRQESLTELDRPVEAEDLSDDAFFTAPTFTTGGGDAPENVDEQLNPR